MDSPGPSQASQAPQPQEINPADCFKILLATDIHLGYKEKDIVIGKKPVNLYVSYVSA